MSKKNEPNGLTIDIFYSEMNEGWMYELYEDSSKLEDGVSYDGGLCTGSLEDALEMATSQART